MLFGIGTLIGLALGLTGAGGSLLAVPLLVLLAGLTQSQAAGLALAAVGLSALFGVALRLGKRQIAWWPAMILVAIGVPLAPVGQWLARLLPESWVMTSFAVLVVVVSVRLWRSASRDPATAQVVRADPGEALPQRDGLACSMSETGYFELRWPCISRLLWVGAVTGLLSGLYGVGGGFVIVPALILLTGMQLTQAVATSLVIISWVSVAGFSSFLWHTHLPLTTILPLVGGACAGMLAGTLVAHKVAGARLQQLLSVALVVLMVLSLWRIF